MALGRPEDTQRRRGFLWPNSQQFRALARGGRKSGDFHEGDLETNKYATAEADTS
jgi:hypothetical protein